MPLENNFLLNEHAPNLTSEVLATEKLLLEQDQIPSAFFRFPGLVSDHKLMEDLNKLGLIPLGSASWLAKGEKPKNGDIVLVHGNGNEPQGIAPFLKLLQRNPNMKLLPLTNLF